MTTEDLQTGKVYEVTHVNKGTFHLRLTHHNKKWITGDIVKGAAGAVLDHNKRACGESITFRKELAVFTEVK